MGSVTGRSDARRVELAESALRTLGELGYARTSLRDIASNSPFSHGVVHYYFEDKLELVLYSLRHHKQQCVRRYDDVVAGSRTAEELLDGFAARLVETVTEDAPMHRLWYDVRTQAMFDDRLQETALTIDGWLRDMVWRVVTRYADLAGLPVAMDEHAAYGVLDGLFQAALFGHLTGDPLALPRLVDQVHGLLPLTVAPTPA